MTKQGIKAYCPATISNVTAEQYRRIDIKIAREAMGWTKLRRPSSKRVGSDWVGIPPGRHDLVPDSVPHYSRNIYCAMEVVEALRRKGASFSMWITPEFSSVHNTVVVAFETNMYPPGYFGPDPENPNVCYGHSLPGDYNPSLAICRAALTWVERSKNV